jgi:hypothetical protein
MFNRDWRADQGALGVGVVAAISVVASLGPAAGESPAAARPSLRAEVHDGILQITGPPGADKVVLGLKPGNPSVLDVEVGDDGTADFSFDGARRGRSTSRAARATMRIASTRAAAPSATTRSRSTAARATTR